MPRSETSKRRRDLVREWADRDVAHGVLLLGVTRGIALRTAARLERTLLEEIAAEVARRLRGTDRGAEALATPRARALLRAIREIVTEGSNATRRALRREAMALGEAEIAFVTALGRQGFGVWRAPEIELLRTAVDKTPMLGRPWGEWFKDWVPQRTEAAVVARVRAGVVAGETTQEIVQGLQGLPEARFRDGVLSTTRRSVETMARTVATHTASMAREQSFQTNADVVTRVRWISTLDLRTTPICINLDGHVWATDEPHPTPPAHWGCRSSLIPAIGEPIGKRASMDGQVDARMTAEEWVKRQSPERQDVIFGKTLGAEFRAGRVTVRDMLDASGRRVLTIRELRRLERID